MTGTVSPTSNATVTVVVTNVGPVAAREVAQLYVAGLPGDPPRALKAFTRTSLLAPRGGAETVTWTLDAVALASWDVVAQRGVLYPPGAYALAAGSSSRRLPATGVVTVTA